jgi:hypothetical protein
MKNHPTVTITVKQWRALLQIAGRQIDPETAEVVSTYGQVGDPYGVLRDIPDEFQCIGRQNFARNPGSDLWIEFGDLPEATRNALWNKGPTLTPIDDALPF